MIHYKFGVALDAICRDDLEKLRTWRNQYEVFRWCRQNGLISDLDQERWFERQNDDPGTRMFLVYPMVPGVVSGPVGVCGLTSIDFINRRAEFSLYINPAEHGQGYGTGALKTILTYGFDALGLNCIWGETFDGNPAAKLFEKLGMKKEGTRRQFYFKEGKFIDCHLYSILRDEWGARLSGGDAVRTQVGAKSQSKPRTAH